MGEALASLCFWARGHMCNTSAPCPDAEKAPVPPFPSNAPTAANSLNNTAREELEAAVAGAGEGEGAGAGAGEEGSAATPKCSMSADAARKSFFDSVSRLSFEKVQTMVGLLDGQTTSFNEFQQELWVYASH
ncbi:uncharacterized protein Tco025E_06222, partial [Trypanosoma conorhini]